MADVEQATTPPSKFQQVFQTIIGHMPGQFTTGANHASLMLERTISNKIASGGSPIMNLQSVGHDLLNVSQAFYGGAVVVAGLGGAVDGSLWDKLFPGGGAAGGAVEGIINFVTPAITVLFIAMLSLGALFAYWLPAIPLVIWLFAGINWIILQVEAVAACLVWAPAHAMPTGDGLTSEQSKIGYMLIISMFMSPALMLVGLFAAMLIMGAAGRLIGYLFPLMIAGGNITSFLGLIGFIAAMTILVSIYVSAADRIFGLITHVRDRILRWVSGPSETLGESEDHNRSRGMVMAAAGRFERGVVSAPNPNSRRRSTTQGDYIPG